MSAGRRKPMRCRRFGWHRYAYVVPWVGYRCELCGYVEDYR